MYKYNLFRILTRICYLSDTLVNMDRIIDLIFDESKKCGLFLSKKYKR